MTTPGKVARDAVTKLVDPGTAAGGAGPISLAARESLPKPTLADVATPIVTMSPRGTLLVDQAGWIRATDHEATAWIRATLPAGVDEQWHIDQLALGIEFDSRFTRLIAESPIRETVVYRRHDAAFSTELTLHWCLLAGDSGSHALVTFESPASAGYGAYLDALTNLPDRRAASARVSQWRQANNPAMRFAVLFVDVDDFKTVNDRFGHAAGDVVLQTLAARLQQSIRDGDLATRYGGDEFVLLIRDAATAAEIDPLLARLAAAIEQPIQVNGCEFQLKATIGWAAPQGTDWTTESLIARADAAMYARKRAMLR